MSQEIKKIVESYVHRIWDEKNLNAIDELIDSNV